MGTERFNMIMKLYPETMELSKKRRELWIHRSEGDAMPKRILADYRDGKGNKYSFDEDGWCIEKATGKKVIRNFKVANKPNQLSINGQSIWDGSVQRFMRAKLKLFLECEFMPYIVRQFPVELFTVSGEYFHFEFIFFRDLTRPGTQDMDNHSFPYVKAFMDTLVHLKVITNDNAMYWRGYYARYVHIEDDAERRLEVKVHFCGNTQRIS